MEGSTRDEIKHTQGKFEMNIKTNIEMNIPVIGGGVPPPQPDGGRQGSQMGQWEWGPDGERREFGHIGGREQRE